MWYNGSNYWRLPLYENEEMIDKLKALISAENIAERLYGDSLRRDQMNFLYSVIKTIDESDEMVRKNTRDKDLHSI